MQWSIRSLLNPVITRCLIYGISPFDLEAVLRKVEEKPLVNSRMLESTWITEWEKKADRFKSFAEEARQKENVISVSEYYALAARCYYACYLLNSDLIENKKKVYENFEHCYEEAVMNSERNVQKLEIPFNDNAYLPGYLHLPKDNSVNQSYGCVVIFTGMGSSKEEVEVE